MKILITGKGGKAGSWKIRGEQLGAAMDATVVPKASLDDCLSADLIIAVKRLNHPFAENIKKSGKPWVWDVVDPYPQPECHTWTRLQSINWIKSQIKTHQPSGIVFANRQMMLDCNLPGRVIYHHGWDKLKPNPIRKDIKIVGYQGAENYLDHWRYSLEQICYNRGWEFVVNPDQLCDVDIVVGLRGGIYSGYAQANWKSNVKLANAHISGTPFIGQPEPGYTETRILGERFIKDPSEIEAAFDDLMPYDVRLKIHKAFLKSAITLSDCAKKMKDYANTIYGQAIK